MTMITSKRAIGGRGIEESRRLSRRTIAVSVGLMIVGVLIVVRAAEPAPVEATALPSSVADAAGNTVLTKSARVLGSSMPVPTAPADSVMSQAAPRESVGLVTLGHADVAQPSSETSVQVAPAETPSASLRSDDSGALSLVVPKNVRVLGPLAFSIEGTRYRLQSSDGLGVSACGSKRGGRCFRRPRGDLKRAIAGAILHCQQAKGSPRGELLACTKEPG